MADYVIGTGATRGRPRPEGVDVVYPRDDCDLAGLVNSADGVELARAIDRDPQTTDVSQEWLINGKRLKPEAPHQPYEPLMVVRTNSHEIINNHNGFFKPEFVDFLVRYVTDIENKRFHQTSQRRSLSQRQSR